MRQQQTHQQSSSASNSKTSNRSSCSSSSGLSTSRGTGSGNNGAINNNNNKSNNAGMNSSGGGGGGGSSKNSTGSSSLKQAQGSNNTTSNNNHISHQNSNSNNNTTTSNNGLASIGHNSSPILPMTPTSSVSPPVNVICKKELNNYGHNNGAPGLSDVMKTTSIHESIKEEMAGMIATNPIAYSNINARLGHGGNSTPLGSNSSVITTPSPPMTPSQNALSYVPNHDSYFWHSQYNQYPNSYNTPASYYSQMDYQGQTNYSMGHSGYSTSNMGLTAGNTFNGSMASQPFATNGLDYMSPGPEKYSINMV